MEVLESAGRGVWDKEFRIHTAQVEKTNAERQKLEAETERLKKENDTLPDADYAEQAHQLEMEARQLEILKKQVEIQRSQAELDRMHIENRIRALDLMERLSELVRNGTLQVDEVEIRINHLLYLAFDEKGINPGEAMGKIAKRGHANLKPPGEREEDAGQ